MKADRRSASGSKQRETTGELDEARLSTVSGGGGGVPGGPSVSGGGVPGTPSAEPIIGGEGVSAQPIIKKAIKAPPGPLSGLKPFDPPGDSETLV
jgi:hypothetical protein